jgi:hypothetical protein
LVLLIPFIYIYPISSMGWIVDSPFPLTMGCTNQQR